MAEGNKAGESEIQIILEKQSLTLSQKDIKPLFLTWAVYDNGIVSPRADLIVINSWLHEEKEEITKPPTKQAPFIKGCSLPHEGAPLSFKGAFSTWGRAPFI